LTKQGAIRKSWKNRFFVLTSRRLRYYETEKDIQPIATVNHIHVIK